MKIERLETWHDQYVCFTRVTADTGAQGWGQTSTYNADITAAVFHRQVAPWALGADALNILPLVERIEEKEQKRGGIIIPDTAKEKPQEGKVIAAGNGKVGDDGKRIPLDVKAGEKILFGKYSGSEVKIDDKEYLILREEDVLAILE